MLDPDMNAQADAMGSKAIRNLILIGLGALAASGCTSVKQLAFSPCHNTRLTLYFETASDVVGDTGGQIIAITANRLKSCPVKDLKLLGLADPTGTPEANLELSKRRAQHVLDAFVKAGLEIPHFTLMAEGAKGATTPGGAVEPVRRQVEVTVVVGR